MAKFAEQYVGDDSRILVECGVDVNDWAVRFRLYDADDDILIDEDLSGGNITVVDDTEFLIDLSGLTDTLAAGPYRYTFYKTNVRKALIQSGHYVVKPETV